MMASLVFLVALSLAPQEAPPPPAVHPLSVLYAGEPGTPREAAWVAFLKSRFRKVETTSPAELLKSKGAGFDVVVADGTVTMHDNRLDMKGCTKSEFPEDWSRPTILISSAGRAAENVSKIGWL